MIIGRPKKRPQYVERREETYASLSDRRASSKKVPAKKPIFFRF
jgi:hypothetical protein